VGDDAYGGSRPAIDAGRPFLHAEYLAFDQPDSGERLEFNSALPEELTGLLEGLGAPDA